MSYKIVKKFVSKKFEGDDIVKIIYLLYDLRNKHKKKFEDALKAYNAGELDDKGVNDMIRSAELASYSHYIKGIVQEVLRKNMFKTTIEKKHPQDILLLAEINAHIKGNRYNPIKNDM